MVGTATINLKTITDLFEAATLTNVESLGEDLLWKLRAHALLKDLMQIDTKIPVFEYTDDGKRCLTYGFDNAYSMVVTPSVEDPHHLLSIEFVDVKTRKVASVEEVLHYLKQRSTQRSS